jgi:hypothetical protein
MGLLAVLLTLGWAQKTSAPGGLRKLVEAAAQRPAIPAADEDRAVFAAIIAARPEDQTLVWAVLSESIDAPSVRKRLASGDLPGREETILADQYQTSEQQLSRDTISDFEARNRQPQKLPWFTADREIVFLSVEEAAGRSRMALRRPGGSSLVTSWFYQFSLPGYSRDRSAALVYFGRLLNREWKKSGELLPDEESLLYLKRTGGRWRIRATLFMRESCYL